MDPVTHTLVGAVTAHAFLKKHVERAVPIMCVASNIPDVDVIALLNGDPANITMRRTFGHSVFLYPIWCAAFAWLLRRVWPQVGYWKMFGMAFLGASLHVFFDLVNSFGVVALWPFSLYRPELAIIFIIDLALLAMLLAPFAATRLNRWQGRLKEACRVAVAVACAYVLFCAGARMKAELLLKRQASGLTPEFSYVFPEPLGAHRWRGVLRFGDTYRVYLINALNDRVDLKALVRTDEGTADVGIVRRSSPVAGRLENFFKAPVWTALPGGEIRVYDLRFRPISISRGRPFEFIFKLIPPGYVREVGWHRRA